MSVLYTDSRNKASLEFDSLPQAVDQRVDTLLPAVKLFYVLHQCLISAVTARA